jgi:hypothetical protein
VVGEWEGLADEEFQVFRLGRGFVRKGQSKTIKFLNLSHESFVFTCREVVYIEKSIAETFQLGNFKPIIVNKVNGGKALTIKNLASNNFVVEIFFF